MLFREIKSFIGELDTDSLSDHRKTVLQPLVGYIRQKEERQETIRLNFICTHNSRRSHLAQVWAQTMACYFGVENVFCHSGGTTVTAIFPAILETLLRTGFEVEQISPGTNPTYCITYADHAPPILGFSKKWNVEIDSGDEFAAVLTCSQANAICPFIPGATKRFFIPYEDPKIYDDTTQRTAQYAER